MTPERLRECKLLVERFTSIDWARGRELLEAYEAEGRAIRHALVEIAGSRTVEQARDLARRALEEDFRARSSAEPRKTEDPETIQAFARRAYERTLPSESDLARPYAIGEEIPDYDDDSEAQDAINGSEADEDDERIKIHLRDCAEEIRAGCGE